MDTKNIVMCVFALILGMLLADMLKNVCGCKNVVEGACGPLTGGTNFTPYTGCTSGERNPDSDCPVARDEGACDATAVAEPGSLGHVLHECCEWNDPVTCTDVQMTASHNAITSCNGGSVPTSDIAVTLSDCLDVNGEPKINAVITACGDIDNTPSSGCCSA